MTRVCLAIAAILVCVGFSSGCGCDVLPNVVFATDRDGDYEIYVMNADGRSPVNLTNDSSGDDFGPSVSADAGRVAFFSNRNGSNEIFVMNIDGSGQTRLTMRGAGESDFDPVFTPTGTEIVFASDRVAVTDSEIFIMNDDGTGQTNLTNDAGYDDQPAVSPDGTKIAFVSNRDGNFEIYIMDIDGSNPTRLTDDPASDGSPAFSTDGSQIVFSSFRDGVVTSEIYVMSLGSSPVRLTNNAAFDFHPAVRSDGLIAFVRAEGVGDSEIAIMNPDGTGQASLTENEDQDTSPSFVGGVMMGP